MKITRLLEITILLLNRRIVTARELADRFGVSVRTIYRDVEVLSSAGVPVYMSKGKGGGISLLENYTLNKTMLSENEIDGLILALKTMGVTRYPETEAILEKISALFRSNRADDDWIEIDFASWSNHPNEQNKFNLIRTAILSKNVISFDYINANGEKSSRFAEPEKLVFNVSTWYLTAFCLKRNTRRVFRLSRIKNAQVTDKHFTKRESRGDQPEAQECPRCTELKLRFSDKALTRLYDTFDERLIIRNEDGSIDVDVAMPEDEWLYGFLLSFGNSAEVLAPEHIRNIIQARLQETLLKYDKPAG